MSETLFEVTSNLYQRQRFITPIVKNLDTGEIYSSSELSQKIPTGVDPSILSQSQRRADLGELLCSPVVPLIPKHWHPNFITCINHICNWCLFLLAFSLSYTSNPSIRILVLIGCAWVNWMCMMLDCLDGMHARRTKQCSKLGEFLDHWLDAIHVPLVCGGITHSLQMAMTLSVGVIFLNCLVYNAQLIVYHYKRVFIQTSGVEGQVLTSGFYLIAAASEAFDPTHTHGAQHISNLIGVIACIVSVKLTYDFVARHDSIMLEKFLLYLILNVGFSALYMASYMTLMAYVIVMGLVSFRVTGCFVLYSILQKPYKGYDLSLFVWLFLFSWTSLMMRPIPLHVLYSTAVPFIPPGWDFFHDYTIQSILPIVMTIHVGYHQVKVLTRYYYKLR